MTARAFGQAPLAAAFIAIALSISALALAVRLFKDCAMENTPVAHITISAAVITDIVALCIFAVVLNVAETGGVSPGAIAWLLTKVVAFFGIVLIGGVKSAQFMNKLIYFGNKGFTVTLIISLCMGMLAEFIGLHMVIGAFLAGLFIREEVIDTDTFNKIEDRIYGLSYSFFGPIFFASLAFHLDFTAFQTAPFFLATIILVAIVGKIVGSGMPAWLMNMRPTEALIIGLAMNNRGAVELIIAVIGLELGIIDQTVFSIIVVMAFVTTAFSILATVPYTKRLQASE